MIKEFFLKQLLKSKLKNLPKDMQERFMGAIDRDPDFFTRISKEIDQEIKNGKSQMAASILVMKKHQNRFRELLS